MRRILTVVLVAALTSAGSLWWLHDGDLAAARDTVAPVVAEWNAELLANDAGVPASDRASAQPMSAPNDTTPATEVP